MLPKPLLRRGFSPVAVWRFSKLPWLWMRSKPTVMKKNRLSILKYALEQPVRMLAQNSGEDAGYIFNQVKDAILADPKSDLGYNAATGKMVSMIKSGILDPAKVTKSALINAVSVGTMILTTEVLIADIPEKKAPPAMPAGGMGGMDGMM